MLVKAGENTDNKRLAQSERTTKPADLVAARAATIEEDCQICVKSLAKAFYTSAETIFNVIHNDLGLVKKSERWVPKLLSPDQMEKRVETSAGVGEGAGYLGRIVTMDEGEVSMHS
jgi:hypothetical protein